jgi:hypothetical protein
MDSEMGAGCGRPGKNLSWSCNTQPDISTNASGLVFTKSLLQRIEHHLGKKSWTGKFQPKALLKDELLNPVVQEVANEVLDAVEKFKKEHTDWSRSLKIL